MLIWTDVTIFEIQLHCHEILNLILDGKESRSGSLYAVLPIFNYSSRI